MSEDKNIRSNITRQDKYKQAFAKKPTATSIKSLGITTEALNKMVNPKKQVMGQPPQKVRNGKNNRKRPQTLHRINIPDEIQAEPHPMIYANPVQNTPEWFLTKKKAKVSVIVPLFKSDKVIIDQIMSWSHEDDVEVIYIDDCCPNKSKQVVIDTWQKLGQKPVGLILEMPQNGGFGRTCNAAAQFATGDYLIFLNADTKVTPGWIKPMIDLFEDQSVGMVGNLHLKEGGQWDGYIDSAGSEWNWRSMAFDHIARHCYKHQTIARPFSLDECPKEILEVGEREMVTGCCFAIRKELFYDVGGFDNHYKIGYWEDTELCMTIREMGYKIMFQPNSVIWHKLSTTGSGNHPYYQKNVEFFHNKWVRSGRIDDLIGVPRPGGKPRINNILLRRFGANGDVIIAASLCPALLKKYPGAKITFSTICDSVLKNNPYVHRAIKPHQTINSDYDLTINFDLAYEYHPNWSILKSYCMMAGVKEKDCQLVIEPSGIKASLPKEYVVMHSKRNESSFGWVGKNWKPERFAELSKRFKDAGYLVVCVGAEHDHEIPSYIDLRGKTTAVELAGVMKNAAFYVGMDSFPMHVAQAMKTPGVAFFGSVNPKNILMPNSSIHSISDTDLPCIGCHQKQPIPCIGTHHCKEGSLACESNVTVDMFWNKIQSVINSSSQQPKQMRLAGRSIPLQTL